MNSPSQHLCRPMSHTKAVCWGLYATLAFSLFQGPDLQDLGETVSSSGPAPPSSEEKRSCFCSCYFCLGWHRQACFMPASLVTASRVLKTGCEAHLKMCNYPGFSLALSTKTELTTHAHGSIDMTCVLGWLQYHPVLSRREMEVLPSHHGSLVSPV